MSFQDKTIEATFGRIKVFRNVKSEPKSDHESEKRTRKAKFRSSRSREQDKEEEVEVEEEEIELKSIEETISADTDKIVLDESQNSTKQENVQEDQTSHTDIFGLENTFKKDVEAETKSMLKKVKHISDFKKTKTKEVKVEVEQEKEMKTKEVKVEVEQEKEMKTKEVKVEVEQEKETASDDVESFGSLRKSAKKDSLKHENADDKQTVPIIKASNLSEEYEMRPAQKIQNAEKSRSEERLRKTAERGALKKDSYHRELRSEVPDWFKMTKEETVEILKKNICYLNEEIGLFAIDKPYGLPSHGGSGVNLSVGQLLPLFQEKLKFNFKLYSMNRLDEFTTGVMLFATNIETANKVREYYDKRKIQKQYLAITKGVPKLQDGEINIPLIRREINGIERTFLSPDYNEETKLVIEKPKKDNPDRKNAITKFRVVDSNNKAALVELQPLTGFKHQIRAHLAFGLECPILGDHKYSHYVKMAPQRLPDEILKCLKIRQSKARYIPMNLHSAKIILPEFHKNANIFISAKLPYHFINNLRRLKLRF